MLLLEECLWRISRGEMLPSIAVGRYPGRGSDYLSEIAMVDPR